MTTQTVVIVLDLDDEADCPSGTAAAAGATPRPFHGWLGLAAAIEALTHPNETQSHALTKGDPA